jgi:TP901 family phage tail tape measure protein
MQVRIVGSANMSQAKAEFSALHAQVAALNAELVKSTTIPAGVNPKGFERMNAALNEGSKAYRNSLASTGKFRVEQMRLNSATEHYTELLQKQKLSFRDLKKNSDIMKQAYKEQLSMQQMTVRKSGAAGNMWDVVSPVNASKDLDTFNKRLGWTSQGLRSAGTQMVNFGKNTQWAGRQLSMGFTMPFIAVGAAAGVLAYNVESAMVRIQKVYDFTAQSVAGNSASIAAHDKEANDLRAASWKTASDAAKGYGIAASDTLKVQADLAATGLRGAGLQKSTAEVMRIATLGELDYQDATTATIALQTAFKLSNKDLTKSFNFMNAVENATSLSLKDITEATPRAASAMAALGVNVEQMTVLLASMKESGVDAAEAANALKSATGTILAPSPSADKFIQQISKGKVQVMELAKASGGNLYNAMHILYDQMQGLNDLQKQQILTKLFGKYQFNRVSAMLTNLGDAFEGASNQTAKAMELMDADAGSLAKIADTELKTITESAPGRFKRMVEGFKVELSEMGKPFLDIASTIIGFGTQVLDVFNKLPKVGKMALAFAAVIMAIAGPLLMVTGLMYNLGGNAVKLAGSIGAWISKTEFLTKEQMAQKLVMESQTAAIQGQAAATLSLTEQISLLAAANAEASGVTRQLMGAELAAADAAAILTKENGLSASVAAKVAANEIALSEAYLMEAAAAEKAAVAQSELNAIRSGRGVTVDPRNAALPAQNQASAVAWRAASAKEAEREAAASQKTLLATNGTAANAEKTKRGLGGGAVAGAAMAASMGTMMITSNHTANSIAQMVLLGTIVVPSAKALAVAMKTSATWALLFNRNMASTPLSIGKMGAGIKGVASGFSAMMGPVGWISAAAAGIGLLLYKHWQHQKAITAEQEKQSRILSGQNTLLNEALDIDARRLHKISLPSPGDVEGMPTAGTLASQLKGSKGGKELVKTYSQGSDYEKQTLAAQTYLNTLQSIGGTANKARLKIEALFLASGMGAEDAETKAQALFDSLGKGADDLKADNISIWGRQITAVMDETAKSAGETGTNLGKYLGDALAQSTPQTAKEFIEAMRAQIDSGWNSIFDKFGEDTKVIFRKYGIDSGVEFRQAVEDAQKVAKGDMTQQDFNIKYEIMDARDGSELVKNINKANIEGSKGIKNIKALEKGISNELSGQLLLKDKVNTLNGIENQWAFKRLTLTKANAKYEYDQEVKRRSSDKNFSDADKLTLARQAAKQLGLRVVNNLIQQEQILAQASAAAIGNAATKAQQLKDNLKGVPNYLKIAVQFDQPDIANIRKSGMTGVMSDLAARASSTFDAKMNASMTAAQNGWDARIAANENANERATKGLDKKWDRINKQADKKWQRRTDAMTNYYDKRIDAVDKAIEAEQKAEDIRQKIFEAEKTRIERLAGMANQNIDFNVAVNSGNLDEAAKIRNDISAQQSDWALSDGASAGSDASAARVDALGKQKDKLDNQKDAALKQLEVNEQKAKDSLARREQNEKDHMAKMQKARSDALKKQADSEIAASKASWDKRKASLDAQTALFSSYVGRNKKDVERWMSVVGLSYDDFGLKVKGKGETWSTWFQQSMVGHIQAAGSTIASDKMWANMGTQGTKQMLQAMGFKGMGEFQKFIARGTLPDGFGTRDFSKPAKAPKVLKNGVGSATGPGTPAHHEGGWIGGKGSSRKGVARTQKGLHPSETNILAQKGEYVVDRRTAAQNPDLLEGLSKGKFNSKNNIGHGTGGGGGPISGAVALLGAGMAKGLSMGIAQQMNNAYQAKVATSVDAAGSYASSGGGQYSDRAFSGQQMQNAAIIASVGSSMGMTVREIEIGIMTAIAESGLVNVNYGDRDSLGLFQQRTPWGTAQQRTTPSWAARAFFNALKGDKDRDSDTPWMAAQHVQRSAFSDGSNYRQFWDNALAIYNKGLKKTGSGAFEIAQTGGVATGGSGGMQRASVPGKGWANSHDYRNGLHSPLYAFNDGRIIESRAIRSGGSGEQSGAYPKGYASYGVTMVVQDKNGNKVRYAHGWPGTNARVGPVKGGAKIMESAATGNASGPHTHFEVNGQEIAREWFQSHGIGLRTGGFTKTDGMANLHKDEVVVDPKRTSSLFSGLDTFTSAMDSVKNIGYGTGGGPSGAESTPQEGISRLFSVGMQEAMANIPTLTSKSATSVSSLSGATTAHTTSSNDSGKASQVKAANYNIHSSTSGPQTKADLAKLVKRVNVMSLQEFSGKKVNQGIQDFLSKLGWGIWKSQGDTAVAWSKKVYDAIGFGSSALNPNHYGKAGLQKRYAAVGEFHDKKTGREFYQVSAHTAPKYGGIHTVGTPAQRSAVLNEQGNNLNALYKRLSGTGKPVFIAGDIAMQAGNKVKDAKSSRGKRNVFQTLSQYGAAGASVMGGLNSDHPAFLSNYNIPGLSKGAANIKWDNTLANLHKGESVLTEDISSKMRNAVNNFASGGNSEYNLVMHFGADIDNKEEIAQYVMKTIQRKDSLKPRSTKG